MKQTIALITLIFSGLTLNAQNIINEQVASNTNGYNWNTDNNESNIQQSVNQTNNMDVQVQTNRNKGNSSALQSFGNTGNNTKKQVKTTTNKKPVVQTNVNKVVNDNNNNSNPYRGNVFQANTNVLDNNVGNENRGRGNIQVNDVNFNSNPVVNDHKKTVASKPIVQEYQGLDFKPSGLSGRDYSDGGKLKKGQKNFYTASAPKHKTLHKKKPGHKKVKHHTSKCATW